MVFNPKVQYEYGWKKIAESLGIWSMKGPIEEVHQDFLLSSWYHSLQDTAGT